MSDKEQEKRDKAKTMAEAKRDATAAATAYHTKEPITQKGKVVDHACAPGRVHRLILKSEEINQTNRPDLTKLLADKRVELERVAVNKHRDAVKAIKKYVEICIFFGEVPDKLPMRRCDCGYCSGGLAGQLDLMLMAGSDFRYAVVKMIITTDGMPDFSPESIQRAKDAFQDYHYYATAIGQPIDVESVFYNEWG